MRDLSLPHEKVDVNPGGEGINEECLKIGHGTNQTRIPFSARAATPCFLRNCEVHGMDDECRITQSPQTPARPVFGAQGVWR